MESAKVFDDDNINFELLKCISCGLVHTEPFLTGADLATYYSSSYHGSCKAKFTSLIEKMVSSLNVVRARMVFGRLKATPQPRLLDVGSGRGGFLKVICRYGVECCGTERSELPQDSDLPFNMYRETSLSLLPGQFDAVTFWHVLEHLENSGEALVAAGRLLKFKVWIVVAVPDYSSLQAKLFGKYWFHLDLPRHLHHFESDWLCGKLA